jgi:hypothetical protein
VLFSLVKGVDFFEKNLIEGGTKPLLCRTWGGYHCPCTLKGGSLWNFGTSKGTPKIWTVGVRECMHPDRFKYNRSTMWQFLWCHGSIIWSWYDEGKNASIKLTEISWIHQKEFLLINILLAEIWWSDTFSLTDWEILISTLCWKVALAVT